ncbi:MAG: MFS transporter [Dehalococcoidia bacterium]
MRGRIFYGWWIVGAMLVALMVGSGLTFWSFTVYIPPLEREFGWSRAQVASAFSVGVIVSGITAPFAGRVIDRVGARRSVAIGSVGLLITFTLYTRVETLWQYFAVFGLQSFVFTWTSFLPFQWTLAQWFVRRRGLALGIATAGFGLGGSVFLPMLTVFIDQWGWRASYQISGFLALGTFLPLALFVLRDRPQDMGLYPDGDSKPPPAVANTDPSGRRWTLGELVRERQFWLLALAQMLFFGALTSFGLHSIPFFESEGRSATFGATLIALSALIRTPARVFAGWALDRVHSLPLVASAFGLLHAGCLLLLVFSTDIIALVAFAVLWGLGGAAGPLIFSLVTARTFGAASFATVSGSLLSAETLVDVLLPPLGGLLYDRQGSYDGAFVLYAISFALSAVAWRMFGAQPLPTTQEPRIRRAET